MIKEIQGLLKKIESLEADALGSASIGVALEAGLSSQRAVVSEGEEALTSLKV